MAVRRIIRMGHPGLRVVAEPVSDAARQSPEFKRLLQDMRDTLADYGGIGLAATQINVPLRVALIDLPGGPSRYGELPRIESTFFINPVLEFPADAAQAGYWEGCLSVPGLRGFVERPQALKVRAINADASPVTVELRGFAATVMQHEFDHLDGVLYVDRISEPGRLAFDEEFERYLAPPPPAAAE